MVAVPETLAETLRASCERFPSRVALRSPGPGGYVDVTYAELAARVRGYCAALRELGFQSGDRLAIQSENCIEWALTDWACQCLGVALVPIYPSLPADQAGYIVRDSQAKLALAGSPEFQEKLLKGGATTVRLLKGSDDSLAAMSERGALSEAEWLEAIASVKPEQLATLIYTSGTTGPPKGVMLPHRSPCFLNHAIQSTLPVNENDVFFSFLPLSHVFERYAGHWLPISCGATIGYMKSLASMPSDLATIRPTIMLVVPRFLEAMQDRVQDAMAKQSPLKQKLFALALSQGKARLAGKFAPLSAALDPLVSKKIRERMGGRLRTFVSGGAAMPRHTFDFWAAFGLNTIQGYGLTETCAGTCLNPLEGLNKPWTVGPPIAGVEVRLADDGEILIRGPSVMDGYYNLPEDTAAALDAEGWFHSGDIGEWEDGYLKITDRKKDLLVLANGKNIAPQHIENQLKESPYIAEAALFGDGNEFVVGLIAPNFERLRKFVEEQGLTAPDDAQLIQLEPIKKLLKQEIDKVNKALADYERVKKYTLIAATFSVESGELTPSMKIRRKVVREKFASEIRELMGK